MKKWKKILTGTAAALAALTVAGGASASVGKVTRELEYRDIKVTLNGEQLDLRNAVGDTVEPFMFGGTNYLPVRALAEALGLEVSWDGANATVVLKEPGEEVHWQKDKGTLGSSTVEIVDAALTWDRSGQPAIVVTYNWTNSTDRRTHAMSEISEAAYQDGVELNYAGIEDNSIYNVETSFKEVRPGTTVTVQAAFVLEDTATPVEFELTEDTFSDPVAYVYHDFPLESMVLPPEPAPQSGPQETI